MLDLKEGVRLQGNVVDMTAVGVANAVPIFQQSNNPNQIGTRTFRLKRIKGINQAGANTDIHIGTGVGGAFVAMVPPLHTFNGLNFDFGEDDIPDVEFAADMTCYPDIAGVGTPVTVMVEVEEKG
jgi:hypothetical protein